MSGQRDRPDDWRQQLGREFNRPVPDSERRDPTRSGQSAGRGAPAGVCAQCGKPTLAPHHQYCAECFRGRRVGGPSDRSGPRPDTGGRRPSGDRRALPAGLPAAYLRDGYFDGEGYLRPELIVDQARDLAETLAAGRPPLSAGALRRFYDVAKAQGQQLAMGTSFAAVSNKVRKMQPHVFDAEKKGKIPPEFRRFIDANVELAVRSEKDFRDGFLEHFMCVVAYFPRTR